METLGTLYVVATPIGNRDDITLRALAILREASMILAEDTRVTAKLLSLYEITTPTRSFHQHSSERDIMHVVERLRAGDDVALVSDAGTPGINDPGGKLVQEVLIAVPAANIVPIPGANAAVTALSVSGFPAEQFSYLGFVPQKKGRQKFFMGIAERPEATVFYESKYRIQKTLRELLEALERNGQSGRRLVVGRELTKKFETFYRGAVTDILEQFGDDELLGEFVVVVGPQRRRR